MYQRTLGLSQWTVTAATAAAGITVEQPEGPAVGSMHLAAECSTGRTLAGAAGIPVRARSKGPCLSFGFAIIFLKKDHVLQLGPLSQSLPGHQCLVFYFMCYFFLDSLHSALLGGEKLGGLCLVLGVRQLAVPLRASLKHQHLKRMGRSCGAVARSACFLHVLLTSEAVPMNVI